MNAATMSRRKLLGHRVYPVAGLVEAFVPPLLAVLLLFAIGVAAAPPPRRLDPAWLILGLGVFSLTFPGRFHLDQPAWTMVRKTVVGWLILITLLLLFAYGSGYAGYFSRPAILSWMVVTPGALVAANLLARTWLPGVLAQERHRRRAVIAGCNATG